MITCDVKFPSVSDRDPRGRAKLRKKWTGSTYQGLTENQY